MNLCVFTGRITKDLSIVESRSGTKVLPIDIAVQRKYKNQNGEYDTDFIICIAFKA
ncbi:single-stranded DNA-binding protein, partial [Staphylococcus nepalensis]